MLPRMELQLRGHIQFLQLIEVSKLDFVYTKSLSPFSSTNWAELCAENRFNGYDLRVVAGLYTSIYII